MLIAFHGKDSIKTKLVQNYGCYWDDSKGCAVGCTLHSPNHGAYETELGIPRVLAHLEDVIFERLPVAKARTWPGRLLEAPEVGANLSLVWPRFAVWLLTDKDAGVLRFAKKVTTKKAIQYVADLWQRVVDGETVESFRNDFSKAGAAAASAAYAAHAASAAHTHWLKCSEKLLELLRAA